MIRDHGPSFGPHAASLDVGRSLRSLRAGRWQLKDHRLLVFHEVRQEHHVAVRKFQGIVMNGGAVNIDLPEDRGFVGDDILAPRP